MSETAFSSIVRSSWPVKGYHFVGVVVHNVRKSSDVSVSVITGSALKFEATPLQKG
jgi:hypothetical protein